MTTNELIRALRETDFSDGCPCELSEMCKDADCIIMQAADRLEELEERVAIMAADMDKHEGADDKILP